MGSEGIQMATMSRSVEAVPPPTTSSESDLVNDLISQNSQLSQEVIDLRNQLAQVRRFTDKNHHDDLSGQCRTIIDGVLVHGFQAWL